MRRAPPGKITGRAPQKTEARFPFPTDSKGEFAQAMSAIACNAGATTKGIFSNLSGGDENFKNQVTQALALQLNFSTTQLANEMALLDLQKAKGVSPDLRQSLQARAAIYGDLLDPAWFVRNTDLSAKAKSVKDRRIARSMLIGSVLLIAQLGALSIRKCLSSGENDALKKVAPSTRGTLAQLQEAASGASPISILQLLK